MEPLRKGIASIWVLALTFVLISACTASPAFEHASGDPIVHDSFQQLLEKYVDAEGNVDYQGFKNDSEHLQQYLNLLSSNPPAASWSQDEQMAYWINAYNAFTIKLIADNYPLKSIQDLHPTVKIPGVSTVWHKKFFKIGGEEMSLDAIEHKILRKQFDDPRIHFAINCASQSCPKLHNQVFVAEQLDEQLNQMARGFVNDSFRNEIKPNRAELSKIFSWFTGDFTKNGSLIDFLNQYSEVQLEKDAKIKFKDYDWSLNEK